MISICLVEDDASYRCAFIPYNICRFQSIRSTGDFLKPNSDPVPSSVSSKDHKKRNDRGARHANYVLCPGPEYLSHLAAELQKQLDTMRKRPQNANVQFYGSCTLSDNPCIIALTLNEFDGNDNTRTPVREMDHFTTQTNHSF